MSARRVYTVVVFIVLASLDNVVIGMVSPLLKPLSSDLRVSLGATSTAIGVTYLVSATAAVAWAYFGDRGNRKPLLMLGTVIWAVGAALTTLAHTLPLFLLAQVVAAAGLGAVASVGFSVVSDLIPPRRRGLVMSLWGLSQGVGNVVGVLLVALVGGSNWRELFAILAVVGILAALAYFFTADIKRGESEPALAEVFAADEDYDYRISRADLPVILRRRTNIWLILQGLPAQLVFASIFFVPTMFQAKAAALGYDDDTANSIGATYGTIFTVGAILALVGGTIGDRVQRRFRGGRALVAGVGILAGIPFYLVLFFMPVRLHVANGAGTGTIVGSAFASIVTEPVMGLSLLIAIVAAGLTAANSPNWFALITEVNPPEHRGTVFSLGNLVNGVGRAVGTGLVGVTFDWLGTLLRSPLNYSVGLSLFQVFFLPTGVLFLLAARTAPRDLAAVDRLLRERGRHPG